jgi:hypothetical protein
VSLAHDDVAPHIIPQSSRLRLGEFETHTPKGLLQHYRPLAGITVQAFHVRFSNRPFEVKRFQTIRHCSVDVARGLSLLFGIGTWALPSWDSRTR